MFPGIDGFHWTPQHIIFLTLFFCVVAVIASTVCAAAIRSYSALSTEQADRIRWQAEFADLPARDRKCRRQITGEVKQRSCPNAFNCGECKQFKISRHRVAQDVGETFGLNYPSDRLYHRGHTWVAPQPDGTVLIGLDDLARFVIGPNECRVTPEIGSRVEANGIAWQLRTAGSVVRVLAPVPGTVVEVGGADDDWTLRVKPDTPDAPHLLRGAEVRAWVSDELDRLQVLLAPAAQGAALADGGVIVDDLQAALPDADWDNVIGRLLLQP